MPTYHVQITRTRTWVMPIKADCPEDAESIGAAHTEAATGAARDCECPSQCETTVLGETNQKPVTDRRPFP